MHQIIKHTVIISLSVITLLSTAMSFAQELRPTPKIFINCTVCHGIQLMGNRHTGAPRLSNLQPWYITNQLEAFKNGWRGNHEDDIAGHEMRAIAESLSTKDIKSASKFAASSQSPPPQKTLSGNIQSGKELFKSCSVCHGENAQGNTQLNAPALANLNDWYIVRQLHNFKQGRRGYNPDDTLGQQMQKSVYALTNDQAIIDVATYITQKLNSEKK